MRYIVSEYQYKILREYFDPIHFVKKKFTKDNFIKPQDYAQYEDDFQKFVNKLFKYTYKSNPLKHLEGFEIIKVTPTSEWIVLLKPKFSDWFNYCKNSKYMEKLKEFENEFKNIARMTAMGTPLSEKGYPENVQYSFWHEC